MKKFVLVLVPLILVVASVEAFAQRNNKTVAKTTNSVTTSSAVKVSEDKFSGKRKVTLSSQIVDEGLSFTINKEFDVDLSRNEIAVGLHFALSGNVFRNAKDAELNFLVDGVRVGGGRLAGLPEPANDGTYTVIGALGISELEKIAKGSKVEMKFGGTVYILGAKVKKNLLAFVTAVKK